MSKLPLTVPKFNVKNGVYLIRPVSLSDKEGVIGLFENLSDKSRYFRFAHAVSELPIETLEELLNANQPEDFAIAAVFKEGQDSKNKIIGMARYVKDSKISKGEFSLSIRDDFQHEGIGVHLLEELCKYAGQHGLSEIYGFIDKKNFQMLGLMHRLSYTLQTDEDDPHIFIASKNVSKA